MPTTNEDFFSREQMQNMAMGLGQGLQGRDFASSFGAALSGTVGADLIRQQRREERQQRLEDLAAIEEKQKQAEIRAEEGQIRAEGRETTRRSEERKQRLADLADSAVRAEESQIRAEARARQNAINQRADLAAWQKQQREQSQFFSIDQGRKTKKPPHPAIAEFNKWFASMFNGDRLRYKGNSPISLYDERTMSNSKQPRSRGMMRTSDGRMVKAVEDTDQDTPIFGEDGRDYVD